MIWEVFCQGSLSPATSLNPSPSPATSCLPYVGSWVPWLASAVRSHFPSPQWVRHSLLLSTPFSTTPLLGRGWLGKEKKEGGGKRELVCWFECLLQRKLPPGLLLPLCAPSHLSLPRSSLLPQALCVLPARGGGGARWEEDGGGGWRRRW